MNIRYGMVLKYWSLLLFCMAQVCMHATAAQFFAQNKVWGNAEDGYANHRIPGICVTNNGTILVATEARKVDSDAGESDIVLKRSTDAGVSWCDNIVIESVGTTHWANPCFVVDTSNTNIIYLFYADNDNNNSAKVYYRISTNDGISWNERYEITRLFEGNPHGWTLHLPGPGHGIKKVKDPNMNRQLLQVWHRKSISFPADQRNYGVSVIYGGSTWKNGGTLSVDNTKCINESALAECSNGQLINIDGQIRIPRKVAMNGA